MNYKEKYIKYKTKYLLMKRNYAGGMVGGGLIDAHIYNVLNLIH